MKPLGFGPHRRAQWAPNWGFGSWRRPRKRWEPAFEHGKAGALFLTKSNGHGNNTMKTYMAKPGEVDQKWRLVDATDQVVGRLASKIAVVLMGKHRPTYTPHVDTGDFVIVTNVEKVALTGNKWEKKEYAWYTGYPGQRKITAAERRDRQPELILREAVRRMLPKNKLGRKMLSKLKLYVGPDHPHHAQNPEPTDFGLVKD